MTQPYVPVDRMRDQLFTLDDLRERLGRTEPLIPVTFSTSSGPSVSIGEHWENREASAAAPAWLTVPGGERYQLSRQALAQLGSACHINQGYQQMIDPSLLQENINWWLRTGLGDRELKFLLGGSGSDRNGNEVPLALALCRGTVIPFSNLRLLDSVLDGIRERYGDGEVLADYKFYCDLEAAAFRLIIPEASRAITGTGIPDDTWSLGLEVRNSPVGLKQTFVNGYLFRWVCTNGQIDVAHSSGGFRRRGTEEGEVYAWARDAVDAIFDGMAGHSLDAVQSLVGQSVERDVVTVLRDLFGQAKLPNREQKRVLEGMAEATSSTMYELEAAVTQAANADDLPWRSREHLMTMGGWLIHTAGSRCGSCRRLLPPNWTPPDDFQGIGGEQDAEPHQRAHDHGQDEDTAGLNLEQAA